MMAGICCRRGGRRRTRTARRRRPAQAIPPARRPCRSSGRASRCSRSIGDIALVQPVIHPDDTALFATAAAGLDLLRAGASVERRGRRRCAPASRRWRRIGPDIVLVHDAARPFASPALIERGDRGRADATAPPFPPSRSPIPSRRSMRPASSPARSSARRLRHGADAAGVRLRRACSTPIGARRPPAAMTSPTMPRWPNGPGSRSQPSKARPAT